MAQDWEIVEVTTTSVEADLIVGFLTSRGVTAEKDSRLFTQEPVSLGTLGDVRIRVPADEAEGARTLLADLREQGPELAEAAATAQTDSEPDSERESDPDSD